MNTVDTQRLGRRAIATAMAAILVVSPVTLRAGDLNAEVNNMFNSLGTIGNYTAPGAFREIGRASCRERVCLAV